ncbi:hypothetical protein [Micromonospora endolithica]|uniref:LppX_LprAFG lipoprotein n=1 Tax=Micromonospora endolithica TaxID=230091 RepID=A0A3A9YV35_9ACTN|nr:hypothetical protein [Micromonospora endolithica]RKN39971.1 hypothetical protein D7223_27945 [Micromonospora endolithica]TWJ26141.1 hypothetical protein JD76_06321 [Micromonospora endolithica]
MIHRRLATTGVALVAALGLGLTGCGTTTDAGPGGDAAAPTSTAPADALGELTAAAQQLNKQSMRVTMTSALLNGSGTMDPATKTSDMTLDMGTLGKFQVLSTGDDVYLKMSGGLLAQQSSSDKWMHLDMRKVSKDSPFNFMPDGDPGGVNKLVNSVVAVERTAAGGYAGTLDYTRTMADDKDIAAFGDKAKAVPFTATVDAEGRLTELVVDTSTLVESFGKMSTRYADFGTPVTVRTPPASEVQEMPTELLDTFAG